MSVLLLLAGMYVQAQVSRGPYLQTLTQSSVIVRWRTASATDSKVTFGTSEGILDRNVTDAASTTEHTVTLSGLQPYTTYYYSVGSSSAILQSGPDNHFLTAPVTGTKGKYTFWVTGDCGNNSTNQKNVLASYNTYMGDRPTNGWLTLGDNAYTSGLDLEFTTNFFDIYQENIMKHAPLWPTPGNHDYANNPFSQIFKVMPYYDIFDLPADGEAGGTPSGTEAYYSYDYDNIHFLSLDSYGNEDLILRLYDTLSPQAQWIKADLKANTKPWVIAYWHHPPYTMASHNSDTEGELKSMRAKFMPFLEGLGVDMVLCGHSHGYERSRPMKGHYGLEATFDSTQHHMDFSSGKYDGSENSCTYMQDDKHTKKGTVYVVAGSSGQLGGEQSTFPHNAMYFSDVTNGGSLILEVEDNRLDAKWLNTDGQIRDNFSIIKNANREQYITVKKGESINLTASWPGEYRWSHTADGNRSQTVSPETSGTYTVSDEHQCVSDVYHVTVEEATSVGELPTAGDFVIFPNPARTELNIQAQFNGVSTVIISDLTGRTVFSETVKTQGGYVKKINTSTYPKGIYTVQVKGGSTNPVIRKLIIE
ncbi:MAG: metallophosphoesterase [Bacteroidota bacterium]